MRNRLLEVSWGSALFPQLPLSSSRANLVLSALFLMSLSGHVSAHLPCSYSRGQFKVKIRAESGGGEVGGQTG